MKTNESPRASYFHVEVTIKRTENSWQRANNLWQKEVYDQGKESAKNVGDLFPCKHTLMLKRLQTGCYETKHWNEKYFLNQELGGGFWRASWNATA